MATSVLFEQPREKTVPTAAAQAESATALVLMSESDYDEYDSRLMLKLMLETSGVRVIEAGDGEAAVSTALAARPDLILIDWGLPHAGALKVMRRLRAEAGLRGVPIALLTGLVTDESRRAAFAAGCDFFLPKPISYYDFRRTLNYCLSSVSRAGRPGR
jgi:CheY-like chemotaxis protein